jgi:O-acetyl-ADP-ribose deacetylase (regulator of RNase III)
MIRYTTGNLLQANVEALVNTVNTVGVMGKGIALQFKEKFSENYKLYKKAADAKQLNTGKMFIVPTGRMDGIKWIINFPTKKHWRYPSKIEFITDGLDDMLNVIAEKNIKSIALPPLGCGNGGLEWEIVKPIIEQKLSRLPDVEFIVFEPSDIAYDNKLKKEKAKPRLTPTRAMILYLMKSYSQLEYSLTVLETQKLVYFLNRFGEEEIKKIDFQKYIYGPYADKLNHVLYDMDGFYIEGMKYKDVKTFDSLQVMATHYAEVEEYININATDSQKSRIETLLLMIEGFETPLSMELLSSVDYVMKHEVVDYKNVEEVAEKLHSWSERKQKIMPLEFIQIAHARLLKFTSKLYA